MCKRCVTEYQTKTSRAADAKAEFSRLVDALAKACSPDDFEDTVAGLLASFEDVVAQSTKG